VKRGAGKARREFRWDAGDCLGLFEGLADGLKTDVRGCGQHRESSESTLRVGWNGPGRAKLVRACMRQGRNNPFSQEKNKKVDVNLAKQVDRERDFHIYAWAHGGKRRLGRGPDRISER